MLTLVDLGPRPDEAVAAIAMVMDVGPRRAAELVEALPAALGLHPALAAVLREELERVGAVVEDREPPPGPVVPISASSGDVSVTLLHPGADRLRVTKAIAAGTGLTLREAKQLVEAAPGVVASGLKPDAAAALRERLEAAGARVAT